MRRQGLRGVIRGKRVRTTVPDAKAPCPLDRVKRVFRAECQGQPNFPQRGNSNFPTRLRTVVVVCPDQAGLELLLEAV